MRAWWKWRQARSRIGSRKGRGYRTRSSCGPEPGRRKAWMAFAEKAPVLRTLEETGASEILCNEVKRSETK